MAKLSSKTPSRVAVTTKRSAIRTSNKDAPSQQAIAADNDNDEIVGSGSPSGDAQPSHTIRITAPFKIERVQRRRRHLKLMIYGNYGTGKTTLAGSSCEVSQMQDVLLINAESGDLSLDHMENLDLITVRDYRTLARIQEYLKRHCLARAANDEHKLRSMEAALRQCDEEDIETPKRYQTVILDSLSEVEAYSFDQLLGVSDTTKLDEDIASAEWKEYKQNHGMILRLVRSFRDLPMHVIFTCGEQYAQDENKRFKFSPDLVGKLSKKVQGFMDMVGYLAIGNTDDKGVTHRRLWVAPSSQGKFDAKHRYQTFKGTHFDEPTIANILEQVGLLADDGAVIE